MNISLAADGIMSDLKLSASVFALASSLYFVPYGLLPVPCSLLAKRAGVRVGLASMCLAFGLVAMSTAGVRGAASLLAMRLALGATEAGVWPFVSYIVSLFFGMLLCFNLRHHHIRAANGTCTFSGEYQSPRMGSSLY